MPVEIREIVVRAIVDDTMGNQNSNLSEEQIAELKEDIIEECMNQIASELKRINDR